MRHPRQNPSHGFFLQLVQRQAGSLGFGLGVSLANPIFNHMFAPGLLVEPGLSLEKRDCIAALSVRVDCLVRALRALPCFRALTAATV